MARKTKKDTAKTKAEEATKTTQVGEALKEAKEAKQVTADAGKEAGPGVDQGKEIDTAAKEAYGEVYQDEEEESKKVDEAEELMKRKRELLQKTKTLKKRKSVAATRIKRGTTRKETLEEKLNKVLGNQTPEQVKAEIMELEAGVESLHEEVQDVEAEAAKVRADVEATEAKLRLSEGKTAKPKRKKRSSKPRVVNTRAIQKSALVRALESRGWVLEKATGEETIDRIVSEALKATGALMEDALILDAEGLDEPKRIDYGKGAVLNVEDALAAA